MGHFIEVCRRRGLKVNAGKSKVILLGVEEGLEVEICVKGIRLGLVSEFKCLGCVLNESGTDKADCSRKVARGRRAAGAIRSLVNDRSLQLECARVLHESLLVPVRMTVVIQLYRVRRRGLELGMYIWTTSNVCWISG